MPLSSYARAILNTSVAEDSLIGDLLRVLDALHANGLEYALCGGMAVNVHGHIRSTTDLDFVIAARDCDRVLDVLKGIGYRFVAGPIPFDSGTPRERVLHRASRVENDELLTVDLLLVTPILEDVWRTREQFEWQGRRVTVVSRDGLAKMKRMAGRHQDLADLENLGLEGPREDEDE